MRSYPRIGFQVFSTIAAALLSAHANADLRYTMTTTIDSPSMENMPAGMMPQISSIYYYTTGKERTDTSMKSSFLNSVTEVIDDCSSGDITTVDPALNIYMESDMNSAAPDPFGISGTMSSLPSRHKSADTTKYDGTVTEDFEVTDLGIETVNNVKARHHKIMITTTTTGNVPAQPGEMDMDIWTDNMVRPESCAVKRAMLTASDAAAEMEADAPSGVKYIFKGNMLALGDTMKGVPVRMQFAIPSKSDDKNGNPMTKGGTFTMDRTDLSTDKLDPGTFEPPTGATKVDSDEYSKEQQDAMQKNMMKGFGGGDNSGGGDSGGGNPFSHIHFHL